MFQNSLLNSIKQDEKLIAIRWANFQKFLVKIEDIREFKEEEYQDGFLMDIFQNSLGYTLKTTNPQDYNLSREAKNETDGKKADGAIWLDNTIVGVIELKAQNSKNLDKIEAQAFDYHNSHSNSKYIIISNFNELRIYIDKKTQYQKFNLFYLSYEEFKKLHLLLSYESIREDIPLKLKEKSNSFEANISKELYRDFSTFRTNLFENLIQNNDMDKSQLLRLTQKLCDRIIFILFGEDRELLRGNSIKEIREHFQNDIFDKSLYEYYKKYFDAINEGNEKLKIPKYNGGLFAKDEILDSLIIDDNILDTQVQKLSNYDFQSEISVNILGHIFEQSLTDLEELQASIDSQDFDKNQTKRKKDGVFYTPEYITKYIVDNTLGKMCIDKREELKITQIVSPKNSKKPTKKEELQKQNLGNYRDWLLNIKILDPACGSGAFLNQALDFLIKEHKIIQDELAMMGDITAYLEIEKSILENNLYGVDINEDATEIAKLSLWLKTAQKGRELTRLADKIKTGNSLIDDKSVVDNAFVWEDEFPDVFAQGGFDIVIGNPPYGAKLLHKEKDYFNDKYISSFKQYDIYVLFYELGLKVLNMKGLLSYITPNKFYLADYGKNIREYILNNTDIIKIVDISMLNVFVDASVYPTIIILSKNRQASNKINIYPEIKNEQEFLNIKSIQIEQKKYNNIKNDYIINTNVKYIDLLNKIESKGNLLAEFTKITRGFRPPKEHLLTKERVYNTYPLLIGTALNRAYNVDWNGNFVIYNEDEIDESKSINVFLQPKILIRDIGLKFNAYFDENNFLCLKTIYFIYGTSIENLKFITTLLNSKLINFYFQQKYSAMHISGGYLRFRKQFLEKIPLKMRDSQLNVLFIQKADKMLELNQNFSNAKQNFINELELEKIPKKLQNFYELEFEVFIKEYKKAKKLKFDDKLEERNFKNEWKALFENDKKIAQELKSQIDNTDKEIDKMVYELYGLSDDEVAIVEGVS